MNIRIKQLRDLVVALDRFDRKLDSVDAGAYRAAASAALTLTHDEMGLLPMTDFAGPVSALQTLAENVHFAVHGYFADLDGSGRAAESFAVTSALLKRMRDGASGSLSHISDRWMTDPRIDSPPMGKSRRRKKKQA